MNSKRAGKFYRSNEKEVMEMLGLTPTKNSGSGWIEKEDGESEHVLCQLKSTDAASIKVSKQDLDTLSYHASVSHKLPVFAIQFLSSNDIYLVVKSDCLVDIAKYIKTGEMPIESNHDFCCVNSGLENDIPLATRISKVILSSSSGRESYNRERKSKFEKKVKKDT